MKNRTALTLSVCATIILGWRLMPSIADQDPQVQFIRTLTKDLGTEEQRASAIAALSDIVTDPNSDMGLRVLAAGKLGTLSALEARDMLKDLALSLERVDETRLLRQACGLSYWQLRVAAEPNAVEQKALLIKLLWGKDHPPPHSGLVPLWAADELSGRGAKDALPEIIKSIKARYSGQHGDRLVWLCRTKIELLTAAKNRQEALAEALRTDDITIEQRLKLWAIQELAKLNTEQSRATLVEYALELQNRYYDNHGKSKRRLNGRPGRHAAEAYRSIIGLLKKAGTTTEQLKAAGLIPHKVFIII